MSEMTDSALILKMLESIEGKVDDLNARQNKMNGTVASLAEWRAAKNEQCASHLARTDAIHRQIKEHRAWIDQAKGAAGASRVIVFSLGALCGGVISAAGVLLTYLRR